MSAPKLFISYSWSSTDHEQRVIDLATDLRESGVDVILDKWDLREGQDAVVFMEQMVTNPEVAKVVIVSDRIYAEKADGRKGGVGTETQIISREVYENQEQRKFVAVVMERDDQGKAYLPTYYKSRIYIDLSSDDSYAEQFEKLLRWIFDKPLHVKPELGKTPAFLSDQIPIALGTTASYRRCLDAIKGSKAHAMGAFDEYTSIFLENLEKFRLPSSSEPDFDEKVVKSIEDFLPHRNEAIQLISAIYQYSPNTDFTQKVHRFFEGMIPYLHSPAQSSVWREWDADNYRFIVHELYLYTLAIMLRFERFSDIKQMLQMHFYVGGVGRHGRSMESYNALRQYMKSLEYRNNRLKSRRLSLRADILKERTAGSGFDFRQLMQADFVAFFYAEVVAASSYDRWWPETLVYAEHDDRTFEVFARSQSTSYFNKVKEIIGVKDLTEIDAQLNKYSNGVLELPRWEFNRFDPRTLMGRKELATRP